MIRPLLAVMAGLLCGVAGLRQARQLTGGAARLRRLEELLRHLSLLLKESALSLPEALEQAASSASAADDLLRSLALRMRSQPLTPLCELYEVLHVSGPEAAALSRLMARLGRGSLESRCQAVDQAAGEIAYLASAAGDKAAKDARMWATLGWTCGACLTLLLL